MNTITNSMELITRQQARKICLKDSKFYAEDTSKFTKVNSETWYVLINTWLLLVEENSQRTRFLLQEYIERNGLTEAIIMSDGLANDIMHGSLDCTKNNIVWLYFLQDIADSVDAERKVLEALRFAKRLSPALATEVNRRSLESFLAVNEENRKQYLKFDSPGCYGRKDKYTYDFDLDNYCYLMDDIRKEYNKLVPWGRKNFICDEKFIQKVWDLGEFSNGSTYEHAKLLIDKIECFSKHYSNWGHILYPTRPLPYRYTGSEQNGVHYEEYYDYLLKRPVEAPNACRVTCVPKSFKVARVIAQEQTWRAFVMQGVRKVWVDYINKVGESTYIDVEDQEPNQEWCRLASIDGGYATVDSSHASDSISMVLGDDLNRKIRPLNDMFTSKFLLINNRFLKSNIYRTAGSPDCFICESCIFLAIARAVTHYADVFREKGASKYLPPRAFGDDVLIDARLLDMFTEVMSQLGFCINQSKSFGLGSDYRESCGVEYRNGYPLHTIKWPRNCFSTLGTGKVKASEVASIISLQHKVFDRSWKASRFLISYVRNIIPDMTSSYPGTECDDLWEDLPQFGTVTAPVGIHTKAGIEACTNRRAALWAEWQQQGLLVEATSEIPDYAWREYHFTLSNSYNKAVPNNYGVEMYRYVDFLKNGPRYACELDRLLNVSMSVSRAAQTSVSSQKWVGSERA